MEVSVHNKFLNLEARIKAENEVRMLEKSSPDSAAEMPFVRQGSGRRPGPLPLQPNGTPTRSRKNLDLAGISHSHRRSNSHGNKEKSEVEAKLQEIMKLTGIITINGKEYHSSIHDLEHLGELGYGSCGHVVKMLHPPSNSVIAIKQMRRSGNREENKRITMDLEVVLKSHDCPYIVQCLGCFVTEADVWICMELMATCFDKLLKRLRQAIPEPILGKVAVATVRALHYLKEVHGVIHRDVKPSNILLDERGNIKLCDFGISGWLEDSKAKTRSAGCAAYMAPERIEPPDPTHPDYDIRADVWSLGITLVELATGQFPYKDCQTDFEVLARVVRDDAPLITSSQGFSPEFCSFVKDCLTKNYKHRPKYKKLLEHPFIKKYQDAPVDVAVWYAQVTRQVEGLIRNSPQRNSNRYTPPSPSLRRVTSEPPPVPPRTPESQRKPLLARLASEPLVESLLDLHGGKQTYVNNKGEPLTLGDASFKNGKEKNVTSLPPWVRSNSRENGEKNEPSRYPTAASPSLPPKPSASSRTGITSSQGRFILPVPTTSLPTLPPRPPVSTPEAASGPEPRSHFRQPPSDLPGLPPRPLHNLNTDSNAKSPGEVSINGNVARFTQLFNAQAAQSSPLRSSPTQPYAVSRVETYESFTPQHTQQQLMPGVGGGSTSGTSGGNGKQPPRSLPSVAFGGPPPTSPRISPESAQSPRPHVTEIGFSRLLSRTLPDPNAVSSPTAVPAAGNSPSGGQLFIRRISAEGIPGRRFSPSPPQPPARNRLSNAGSSSVPASPVLQPRHTREHSEGSNLPRYFTPEPQRRSYGKMEL